MKRVDPADKWNLNGPTRKHQPPGPCAIDGCDRPRQARGWCMPHYNKWHQYGDPLYTPKPKKKDRWVQVKGCTACEQSFLAMGGRNTFCSERCCRRAHKQESSHVRRARLRAAGKREAFTIHTVLVEYGTTCHLCDEDGADTIDHVIPVSKGGAHTVQNVRPAHRYCNERRRDDWLPLPEPELCHVMC